MGQFTQRQLLMADLYRKSETMQQLGIQFGVSRERVCQLLTRTT